MPKNVKVLPLACKDANTQPLCMSSPLGSKTEGTTAERLSCASGEEMHSFDHLRALSVADLRRRPKHPRSTCRTRRQTAGSRTHVYRLSHSWALQAVPPWQRPPLVCDTRGTRQRKESRCCHYRGEWSGKAMGTVVWVPYAQGHDPCHTKPSTTHPGGTCSAAPAAVGAGQIPGGSALTSVLLSTPC